MVSGYLLLKRSSLELKGTMKRVGRILFLILGWSIIHLLVRKVLYGVDFLGNPVTVFEGIRSILLCKANTNLWFLYVLCAVYIVAPILHSFVHRSDKHILRYFVILSFFAITVYGWICGGLCEFFDVEEVYFKFLLVNSIPITYFVAGYYFGYKDRFRLIFQRYLGKKHDRSVCIAAIICLIVLALIVPGLALHWKTGIDSIMGKLSCLYTVAIFLLLKYIGGSQWFTNSMLAQLTTILGPLTLGVYMMHPFAQYAIQDGYLGFHFSIASFHPIFSIPVGLIAVVAITASAAYVMMKIPIIRLLVK